MLSYVPEGQVVAPGHEPNKRTQSHGIGGGDGGGGIGGGDGGGFGASPGGHGGGDDGGSGGMGDGQQTVRPQSQWSHHVRAWPQQKAAS